MSNKIFDVVADKIPFGGGMVFKKEMRIVVSVKKNVWWRSYRLRPVSRFLVSVRDCQIFENKRSSGIAEGFVYKAPMVPFSRLRINYLTISDLGSLKVLSKQKLFNFPHPLYRFPEHFASKKLTIFWRTTNKTIILLRSRFKIN